MAKIHISKDPTWQTAVAFADRQAEYREPLSPIVIPRVERSCPAISPDMIRVIWNRLRKKVLG